MSRARTETFFESEKEMATSAASPTIDRSTVKSVLISFGERRREITFSGGVESLYAQTNHVFGDVLQEKRINVLQMKIGKASSLILSGRQLFLTKAYFELSWNKSLVILRKR